VTERKKLESELISLRQNVERLTHAETELTDIMQRMRNSTSWKLTMPIRMLGRLSRGELHTVKAMLQQHFTSSNGTLSHLLRSGDWKSALAGLKRVLFRHHVVATTSVSKATTDVCILATTHTLFVAHLIEKNLLESGIKARVSTLYAAENDHNQLHIVVCPQMFPQLPKHYIAFQMEQSGNARWFTDEYFTRLENAIAIFDYSLKNIEYLLQQGIPYQKLFYMPISSYADYPNYLAKIGYDLIENTAAKPIDVLFYGDANCDRRKAYLNELKKHFNVTVASEVFGASLTKMIRQARVVVNIHYYEGALLETTRLYETLSLGTPIVSESSVDIEEYQDLAGVIDFCPTGDIPAMIAKLQALLSDDVVHRARVAEITNLVAKDNKNSLYLKRYLLSTDKITLPEYQSSLNFAAITDNAIPRLCLSLSETPVRRKAFFANPTYGFQFSEGLRHHIGWIGCGMSYKYILSSMLACKSNMLVVCEDDVISPKDFDKNLEKVISHLKKSDIDWHIFCGIIAHLHEETKILDVKNIDGIEYVYINKMTSMVMNIYSQRGMELIAQWDEKNSNANTNTIDRYVEATENLVVVTTLPFMVGYAEEQQSTLWGIKNTEYTPMIAMSEAFLAEKVAEFKLNRENNGAPKNHDTQ
jgi:GR25 family glycosyltransferase involved in LPS biosynthesis